VVQQTLGNDAIGELKKLDPLDDLAASPALRYIGDVEVGLALKRGGGKALSHPLMHPRGREAHFPKLKCAQIGK